MFQGVPYVEGNGMSGLYKLQVTAAFTAQYSTFSLISSQEKNLCLSMRLTHIVKYLDVIEKVCLFRAAELF